MKNMVLASMTLLLALVGCTVYPTDLPSHEVLELSHQPYPEDVPLARDLDIVVVYREMWFGPAKIQLVNRTPDAVPPMYLWLNRQYVGMIDGIEIGQDNYYNLPRFINAHREPFPVGYPVTPDRSQPVVQAELFDPDTGARHRLAVQKTTITPWEYAGLETIEDR